MSSQSPPKKHPLVLEKKTESAIFQVCGENETCVENALSWIQDLIKKEQCPYTSEDECIKDFDEKEFQELNELQRNLNITIFLDHKRPLIEVWGIKDAIKARDAIENMIKRVRLAKEQESRAACVSEFIEWQYEDNNIFHNFDKITNLQLEEAKKEQRKTVNIKINHQSYTVDLKLYTATGAKGRNLSVRRLMKSQGESNFHAGYPLFYSYFELNLFRTYIKTVFK